MTDKEIIALLRMTRVPGLGPIRSRELIRRAGSPTAVFADKRYLREAGWSHAKIADLFHPDHLDAARSQFRRARREGVRLLSYRDPSYPSNLSHCADAPLVLFQKGQPVPRDRPLIAVVGTRKMTQSGGRFCERLVRELLPFRPVIISGLAYGVDICAQALALELGLHTIACMAHGLDRVYPYRHARYVPDLLEKGTMLSECWLGTPPGPGLFLRRNRLIAGMSQATVVVESPERGGSLVTADLAFGYDREVFAIPGRPGDPMSTGCNRLIREQKAQLLCSAAELAETMGWNPYIPEDPDGGNPIPDDWPEPEKTMLHFLKDGRSRQLDEIAIGCEMCVADALTCLLQLEMKGYVRAERGKRYSRRA